MPAHELAHHIRGKQAIDTVRRLRTMGKSVVLMAHYGRPHGQPAEYSLKGHAEVLAKELDEEVCFLPFGQFEPQCSVALLENTRFYRGERRNGRRFARHLARVADVFVQDAFSVIHRKHASVHRVATLMTSFAGPHLVREVSALSDALHHDSVQLILGGAKLETKIPLLRSLLPRISHVFLGSYFLYPKLMLDGQTFPHIQISKKLLNAFDGLLNEFSHKIYLPQDALLSDGAIAEVHDIPHDASIDDIGSGTVEFLREHVSDSARIIWNGPLGKSQQGRYAKTAVEAAHIFADIPNSVIGGGDTVSLLAAENIHPRGFVSAGGGAMLAFLESQDQPGLTPLYN
jgi:phosphoglycerate kinase